MKTRFQKKNFKKIENVDEYNENVGIYLYYL